MGWIKMRLTWSKMSMHNSASPRFKLAMNALPSLSTKISTKVRTALPSSSLALVTSFHSRG